MIPTKNAQNRREYDAAGDHANILVLQNGKNYKVSCMIGLSPPRYIPQIAVVDTGAGPNIIRKDLIPKDWKYEGMEKSSVQMHIKDANGRLLSSVGTLRLPCQVGGLTTNTDSSVVEGLEFPIILGCNYIDKNILSIRPKERIIELRGHKRAYLHG